MGNGGSDEVRFGIGVWLIIGGYLLFLLIIGAIAFFFKRKRGKADSMAEHYVAGNDLGYTVILMTIFSTNFSGYTIVGLPGDAYRLGYAALMWICGILVGTEISYMVVCPRLFRLSRKRGYISPLDFIRDRYKSTLLCCLVGICMFVPSGTYILAQCKSMGDFVEGLSGGQINALWGATFLAIIMFIYETLGGMRSVAWTDVLQGFFMLLGFSLLFVVSWQEFGSSMYRTHYTSKSSRPHCSPACFNTSGMVFLCYLIYGSTILSSLHTKNIFCKG